MGKCTATPGTVTLVKTYPEFPGLNCYKGHGATELDGNTPLLNVSVQECVDYCESSPACTAAQYKVSATGGSSPARSCWRRSDVNLSKCIQQKTQDVYLRPSRASGGGGGGADGALLYAAALLEGPAPPLSGY